MPYETLLGKRPGIIDIMTSLGLLSPIAMFAWMTAACLAVGTTHLLAIGVASRFEMEIRYGPFLYYQQYVAESKVVNKALT